MSDIGHAIGQAMVAMIVIAIVLTALVTADLIFGLPWLWQVLKPWLHQITG